MAQAPIVIPRARLQPALDRDLLALAEVGPGDLRKAVPGDDGVVLGLLSAPADELVAGDRERRDVLAAREAAHLRVPGQPPRQHDLVHQSVLLPGRPGAPVATLRSTAGRALRAGRRNLAGGSHHGHNGGCTAAYPLDRRGPRRAEGSGASPRRSPVVRRETG